MASTSTNAPVTARVKRYRALFTRQVTQKTKKWADGYIRHHHANSKIYLLSSDMGELASTFWRPPAFLTTRIAGGNGGGKSLADSFALSEGEEVQFEEGYLVEVGECCFESDTNLTELRSATREARKIAASQALEWAASVDSASSPRPRPSASSTSSSTPFRSDSHSTSSAKGKERARDSPVVSTSVYKGFGVAPPRSYQGGKTPSLHPSGTSHQSRTSLSTKTPYARPPPPLERPTPIRIQQASASTPRPNGLTNLSTPSRAASSPFRPPSFTRPISAAMTEGGTTPDSAKRKTLGTSGGPSSAMERKSLLLDWNKFSDGGQEGQRR